MKIIVLLYNQHRKFKRRLHGIKGLWANRRVHMSFRHIPLLTYTRSSLATSVDGKSTKVFVLLTDTAMILCKRSKKHNKRNFVFCFQSTTEMLLVKPWQQDSVRSLASYLNLFKAALSLFAKSLQLKPKDNNTVNKRHGCGFILKNFIPQWLTY